MRTRTFLSETSIAALALATCVVALGAEDANRSGLASALIFHAAFDDDLNADVQSGDGKIYTAETLARKEIQAGNHRDGAALVRAGRFGGSLRFSANSKKVLFYKVSEAMYGRQNWSGTYSFWLKLDPNKDLEPGYCDPIQITDKKWNDAAMFVDFDKDLPRDFRLGVFSNIGHWNPEDVPWDKFPVDERPMVTVKSPPFSNDEWTHVAFTFSGVNRENDATATLYLNGVRAGELSQSMQFQWDVPSAAMMIGIQYIGDFDDLAIFNRALSGAEISTLYKLADGVAGLKQRAN